MNINEIIKNINVNCHSSIQVKDYFFDPFKAEGLDKTARVVFLTHTHYDHLDLDSLKNVVGIQTIIVATKDAEKTLEESFPTSKKIYVKPNENFEVLGATVGTFPAYNINKNFHKKESNWVGYKLTLEGTSYAVLGDTDVTPELKNLKCDVLFVPIGGTYTMTANEAATLVNLIKPKLVIPVHYNSVVGNKEDEKTFISNLNKDIICKTFL